MPQHHTESVLGKCPNCSQSPMPLYDVGAYDTTRYCSDCIRRYGARNLAKASNAALAMRQAKANKRAECLRCGSPLVMGSKPMCAECNQVYRDRFGKDVVWR